MSQNLKMVGFSTQIVESKVYLKIQFFGCLVNLFECAHFYISPVDGEGGIKGYLDNIDEHGTSCKGILFFVSFYSILLKFKFQFI